MLRLLLAASVSQKLVAEEVLSTEIQYLFNFSKFSLLFVIGLLLSELIYNYSKRFVDVKLGFNSIMKKGSLVIFTCTIPLFTALYYLFTYSVVGWRTSTNEYFLLMIMQLCIGFIEFLLFISLHYQFPTSRPDNKTYIYFKSGSKHITLHLEDLAYIQSKGGLVILMDMYLNSYTTQFSSINEIDFNFHESLFLRVNRQYIINRSIIKSVHETKNRKLSLYLNKGFSPTTMPILVSRHKRKDVIKWFTICSKK